MPEDKEHIEPHYRGITGTPPWARAQQEQPTKKSFWAQTWWYWAIALIIGACLIWVAS